MTKRLICAILILPHKFNNCKKRGLSFYFGKNAHLFLILAFFMVYEFVWQQKAVHFSVHSLGALFYYIKVCPLCFFVAKQLISEKTSAKICRCFFCLEDYFAFSTAPSLLRKSASPCSLNMLWTKNSLNFALQSVLWDR